jgi:hypothetical protein
MTQLGDSVLSAIRANGINIFISYPDFQLVYSTLGINDNETDKEIPSLLNFSIVCTF